MTPERPSAAAAGVAARAAARAAEIAVLLLLGAFKVWLTAPWTVTAIGWSGHDDRLYLLMGKAILDGAWLGPYNDVTLLRGIGYPLFIAAVENFELPLLIAQQVFYVFACAIVIWALSPVLGIAGRLTLYTVLVLNPMTFTNEVATRVIREGIYPTLTLLLVAGFAGALLRLDRSRISWLPWSIASGVILPAFWHTREEGPWIAPFLAAGALVLVLRVWRRGRKMYVAAALAVAIPALFFAAATAALLYANEEVYGVRTTVEVKQKEFVRAYGSLLSVRAHPPIPRVPVPREARERIYAVSPAFAELRPHLEGPVGERWMKVSASEVPGDIGGGWFLFALRESVAAAGYYEKGAPAAAAFYDRLSNEIGAARRSGRLDARKPRASLVPPLSPGERVAVVRTWFEGLGSFLRFSLFSTDQMFSTGLHSQVEIFSEITNTPRRPREPLDPVYRLRLKGLVTRNGKPIEIAVMPDGRTMPTGMWKGEYDLRAVIDDAALVLVEDGRELERMRVGRQAPVPATPGVDLGITETVIEISEERYPAGAARQFRVMEFIGAAYRAWFPAFLTLVAILWVPRLRRLLGHAPDRDLALLIGGIFASTAARILILALIEVTSCKAMYARYQAPGHAILLLATVLAAHQVYTSFRGRELAQKV